jgi:hypothetical protein
MGVFCCSRRKTDYSSEKEKEKLSYSSLSSSKKDKENEDSIFNEMTQQQLKDFYLKASKEENLELLLKLVDNPSRVILEDNNLHTSNLINHSPKSVKTSTTEGGNWIQKPETLGELSLMKIFSIIETRLEYINTQEEKIQLKIEEKNNQNPDTSILDPIKIEENKNEFQSFMDEIKDIKFIVKIFKLLESDSNTIKDLAILILSELSSSNQILSLMLHKDYLQKLILHISCFRNLKCKNSKEHIVASLQIIRRIYVKNLNLRRNFLELGGFQLLYENIMQQDIVIIQEVLYNIEDLIYVRKFRFIFIKIFIFNFKKILN